MAEKVYIMGEVMKPGEYVIEDRNATVIESIGMAGEFTRIAAPNRTTIIRIENGRERIITVPVDDITQKGLRSRYHPARQGHRHRLPTSFYGLCLAGKNLDRFGLFFNAEVPINSGGT